jgi:hypothetical protein
MPSDLQKDEEYGEKPVTSLTFQGLQAARGPGLGTGPNRNAARRGKVNMQVSQTVRKSKPDTQPGYLRLYRPRDRAERLGSSCRNPNMVVSF